MVSVEISLKMELVEKILARDFTLEKMEKLTVTVWRDGFLLMENVTRNLHLYLSFAVEKMKF